MTLPPGPPFPPFGRRCLPAECGEIFAQPVGLALAELILSINESRMRQSVLATVRCPQMCGSPPRVGLPKVLPPGPPLPAWTDTCILSVNLLDE